MTGSALAGIDCRQDHRGNWWIIAPVLTMLVLACQPVSSQESSTASIEQTPLPGGHAPSREGLQSDPSNSLRIYRPPGGFKQPSSKDPAQENLGSAVPAAEPDNSGPVFFAERVWADPGDSVTRSDLASPPFAQVLDGFSARWQHRLGTPSACAMVLCHGSCADSDNACELAGSWRGESAGCAAMPEGAMDCCADQCSEKSDC